MVNRYAHFSSAISSINQYITRIEATEMEKYNLKGSHAQYIMAVLSSEDGLTAKELSEKCAKDKAAVSRGISGLEEMGLIRREAGKTEIYRSKIVLTDKGREAAELVCEKAVKAVERASRGYDKEDRELFYSILDMISENLREISEHGLE